MLKQIPFVKNELKVVDTRPGFMGRPDTPIRDTPVTPRENITSMFWDKHPYYLPAGGDIAMLNYATYSEQLGRGRSADSTDAFGLEWEYIPAVKGSIVRPGAPLLQNVNDWPEKIHFPDLDTWDWAAAAEANKIDPRFSCQFSFVNGFWFERLISFMDFADAAVALIDEEQEDALMSLFKATTDMGCKLVDKFCEYWPMLDGFNIHDDWGAQKAPFFSDKVAYKFFVPFMKQITDHIHSKGRFATLHSCGHTEDRVQAYIDGGFDQWDPQAMNDTHTLYEKFGDKIIIGMIPDQFDPEHTTEAEQRQYARDFAKRFCKPGKPCMLSHYGGFAATPAFTEELYECSRKYYLGL